MSALKHENPVLDHGYIELHDWMGDDLMIVNMARQSFGKESTKIDQAERGLINFLMREKHGTPFEGPVFTFNVKCPLFVAREWMRHRISSYNEYSGRYSEMLPDFYTPELKQMRLQKGKPGHYKFEPLAVHNAQNAQTAMRTHNEDSWLLYKQLLDDGLAKELARMVLPVNQYTQFTWVINLRSLFNFVALRSAENAMFEIRQYSLVIEELIKQIVPEAYEAFIKNGRNTP
jgi:thymidylate synthase (FAD)